MTTLTLDQAKTILFSSVNASAAFSSLSKFNCEVKCLGTTHFLYIDTHVVMFFDGPVTDELWIFIDDFLVRQPNLLESQQQPTESVPAVSTAVEARPYSHPENTLQMLDCFRFLFGIDTANGQYQDILFDVIRNHLTSNSINFNDLTIAEIRSLMFTADDVFDHLMTSVLSTQSVPAFSTAVEARPDLPVLQESCECSKCKSAHGILNVYAHGLVTVGCPDCWHSDQSLISVMAETFFSHLSTESVDKAGE